jgi:L-lactate dehydrogenase (cytochrome)
MIIANTSDERALARRRLPRSLFDYIDGGSYSEVTLRQNVAALEAVRLRQRVMRDVSQLDLGVELFGQSLSMPLVLGPVGFAGMFAHRGEVQAARAAASAGVPFTLSTVGICSLEEVAKASSAFWYQLYMIKDRGYMAELLARASTAGCPVLVFTVDLPVAGARYRDLRSGFSAKLPPVQAALRALDGLRRPAWLKNVYFGGRPHTFGNIVAAVPEGQAGDFAGWIHRNFDPSVTFADIEWVRRHWKGPIVLKGVLDPDDARQACLVGVDGVVVSNHGGRQLDGASPSIEALPRVLEAVDGRAPVLMDGGVRSGLDVLKALAVGASAVMIGRAWAYALAAGGEPGVARMLARFRQEIETAMALTGCTALRGAGPDLLLDPAWRLTGVARASTPQATRATSPGREAAETFSTKRL